MQRLARAGSVAVTLAIVAVLVGCSHGGGSGRAGAGYYRRDWNPPGPPSDPWGPYIKEAAARFNVPERWVRAVMRQESGGHQYLNGEPITSSAGAAGLMQVMPATYDMLAARYGLGPDLYDPHDNIMAGTAYIREMYERYGSPGFLAAYNAGPGRMDSYLAGRGQLPIETVNYLAAISPRLGPEEPGSASAPMQYASVAPQEPEFEPIPPSYVEPVPDDRPTVVQAAAQEIAPVAVTSAPAAAASESAIGEDRTVPAGPLAATPAVPPAPAPLAAPQPIQPPPGHFAAASMPLPPAPPPLAPSRAHLPEYRLVAGAPYADGRGPNVAALRSAAIVTATARTAPGEWGIQVGAYASPALARLATEGARQGANLQGVQASVQPFDRPAGGRVFRARLTGFSGPAAREACARLRMIGSNCFVVPPSGGA